MLKRLNKYFSVTVTRKTIKAILNGNTYLKCLLLPNKLQSQHSNIYHEGPHHNKEVDWGTQGKSLTEVNKGVANGWLCNVVE